MAEIVRVHRGNQKHQSKLIQHLGIVAGMCNECGLAERIDRRVPGRRRRKVSVGQAVQAMILNALGFSGRALYLTPRFYKNRSVEVLVGEGIRAEQLHDASLGTALDALYEAGITEIFYGVASEILREAGIAVRFAHLDSTTFSLHGRYNSEQADEEIEEGVIRITKGYSKDNQPQLNQVVVQLICTQRSSLPVWIEALSGNTADKKSFGKTVREFQRQFRSQEMPYMVMDAAFYSKENLAGSEGVRWVTRVPETLKEVKQHYQGLEVAKMRELGPGYRYVSVKSRYAGVEQRWLIVHSEQSRKREIKTFEKRLDRERERSRRELKHLSNRGFACVPDAREAAERFCKSLRHQRMSYRIEERKRYRGKDRPGKGAEPVAVEWYISAELHDDEQAIAESKKNKGLFVIATNELDEKRLSDQQLLEVYKEQGVTVERGFRFLKDPLFYAESLYLKSPQRIMALLMVMTLSLLVYSLAEIRIRKALQEKGEHIWNQKNKPTDKPTIRWVFMIFEDVLLLYTHTSGGIEKEGMNLREEHRIVLKCLGAAFEKMYFLRK